MLSSQFSVQKILILRFSSLGDIVMTTAMIRSLRSHFPNAQIDMVVREDFADVIRHNAYLTNKIYLARDEGIKGLWRLLKTANSTGYDVIYDAHRSLRTLFLMPFLRAKQKFYFQKHYVRRSLALTFKLPLLNGMPRFLERYTTPLAPLGVVYDGRGPECFVTDVEKRSAASKISLKSPEASRIALIPSAQWPGKRWPIPYFRALAELIIANTKAQILVFGGKADDFCHEIAKNFPMDRVQNLQGKMSIAECGAALQTCQLTIANDTGLMHLADALGIPSVLFLGPTSAGLGCLPFHPRTIVMERKLWCRPCSKNGQAPCIRMQRKCLNDISPAEVFDAVRSLSAQVASR